MQSSVTPHTLHDDPFSVKLFMNYFKRRNLNEKKNRLQLHRISSSRLRQKYDKERPNKGYNQ